MSTALDLIKKSMRLIGALGQGEVPTASEATDGLDALNTMLDSWSIERLMVYQILQETFTWTGGQSSRTIGSGGNFATTRPVHIENGFTRISDSDYPYTVISKEQYDSIVAKTSQSSYPDVIYYQPSYPLGILYAYPVPSASVSFYLNSWKQLQQFTSLTTDLALPPGYKKAIEYNLAIEIAPEFGLSVSDGIRETAAKSKGSLKRLNSPSMVAQVDSGAITRGRRSDIRAG